MLEKYEGVTPPQESNKTMQEIANRNYGIWNIALQTGNPKEVAVLYIADATFLPTFLGEFKKGQYFVEEYFKRFLEKNPTGEIIQEEVQTLGTDCYLHSGTYNFEVDTGDDRHVVKARFSFVWKKDDQGEWKIVHHHSSVKQKVRNKLPKFFFKGAEAFYYSIQHITLDMRFLSVPPIFYINIKILGVRY